MITILRKNCFLLVALCAFCSSGMGNEVRNCELKALETANNYCDNLDVEIGGGSWFFFNKKPFESYADCVDKTEELQIKKRKCKSLSKPIPKPKPKTKNESPDKVAEPIRGGVYKTHTYWEGGWQAHQCLPELVQKTGMIIIGAKDSGHSKVKGSKLIAMVKPPAYGCSPPGHCNGHKESCESWYRTEGCYLNKKWHDWYIKRATHYDLRLPTDVKSLCKTS